MKVSTLVEQPLDRVPKAKNLDRIGWHEGYFLAVFKGRPIMYVYGPDVAVEAKDKILANPYPDRLFTLTIQGKYQCFKIGGKA